MKSRCSGNTRRGVMLVELVVVMSSATIVLSMSAVLIHRIMRVQSSAYEFFDVERSALRLSSQFRSDVHAATDASLQVADNETILTLQLADDQTVRYERAEANVVRLLFKNGDIVARESFSFPADTRWTIEEHSDPRRLVISLDNQTPDPVPQKDSAPQNALRSASLRSIPVCFQVEACLGRAWPGPIPATSREESE